MHQLEQERARRIAAGEAAGHGARHVMQVGAKLIDGYKGYTGAQYINAYYRSPKGQRVEAECKSKCRGGHYSTYQYKNRGGNTVRVWHRILDAVGEGR